MVGRDLVNQPQQQVVCVLTVHISVIYSGQGQRPMTLSTTIYNFPFSLVASSGGIVVSYGANVCGSEGVSHTSRKAYENKQGHPYPQKVVD